MKTIESLFDPEPQQWGLRGDPYLWQEMAAAFHGVPMPATATELARQVEQRFEKLTGQPMSATEWIRLERHAHGGMSSGGINPQFWRQTALPLLLARYEAEV